MKINKLFCIALGLGGIILSSLSYAEDSAVGTSAPNSGTKMSPDASYGIPRSEVTIDPANAKSEQPYPPITNSNRDQDKDEGEDENENEDEAKESEDNVPGTNKDSLETED